MSIHKLTMVLIILPFLLFIAVKSQNQSPTATIIPNTVSAVLKLDPDESTTFSCEVTEADGANWLVDGLYADDSRIRSRGITLSVLETLGIKNYRRNITIPHNIANSETNITCEADRLFGDDVHSSPVILGRVIQDTDEATTTKESRKNYTTVTGFTPGTPSRPDIIGVTVAIMVTVTVSLLAMGVLTILLYITLRNRCNGTRGTADEEMLENGQVKTKDETNEARLQQKSG